jgi:ClpP class serine protease
MIPQLFEPWLITESGLRLVWNVASRNAVFTEDRIRALEERAGKPLQNTRNVTVRDGVAIIPVQGPLLRHASMFTDISGATSYEALAKDFAAAMADPAVQSIRFYIDSPGGEVNGCFRTGRRHLPGAGKKNIQAFVEGAAASAAYALASACDEIVCSPASFLGSIGAVMSATDKTKAEKDAGELTVEFVSSVSPDKRPDIKTPEGRAIYQDRVNALGDLFVERVARNRGRSVAYVLEHFGQGAVRIGAAAVAAGLADRLSDFESSLAEMAGRPNPQGARMADPTTSAPDDDEDKEGDDEECKAKKAKARKAKADAKRDEECRALGAFALSLSGKAVESEARAVLTLAMESHREVAGLRETDRRRRAEGDARGAPPDPHRGPVGRPADPQPRQDPEGHGAPPPGRSQGRVGRGHGQARGRHRRDRHRRRLLGRPHRRRPRRGGRVHPRRPPDRCPGGP